MIAYYYGEAYDAIQIGGRNRKKSCNTFETYKQFNDAEYWIKHLCEQSAIGKLRPIFCLLHR